VSLPDAKKAGILYVVLINKYIKIRIQHTLVLTTPKITIPSAGVLEFVKELISSNLTNVDYFWCCIDNGDYDTQAIPDTSTYITFIFFR
jgi:hypothetical protein